jgi:uncharacterized protein (TIGR03435 family)
MIRMIGEIAIAVSGSLALSLVIKATVVSAGTLIAVQTARRSRASVRHALLATAFLLLLMLPAVSVALPPREVFVPIAQAGTMVAPVGQTLPDTVVPVARPVDVQGPTAAPASDRLPPMSVILLAAWLAGVALSLVQVIAGFIRIRRVRRNGLPWRAGQAIVTELAAAVGVHRRIQVLLDEAVAGPMTCGVVRPTIVLPLDARTWARADLRRAVVHEVEHIRRGDWFTLCVARVVCAIYWFHPLVWIAWRQLRLEAEKACDDAVLREALPEAYADQLVTLAERVTTGQAQSALAMANRGDLFARVSAVLDDQQARGRAGARWILTAGLIGVLLLAGIAPLRAVVRPHAFPQPAAAVAPHREEAGTSSMALVQLAAPPAALAREVPTVAAGQVSTAAPTPARPQAPTEIRPLPRFDVVSIKVNNSGAAFPGFPRLTPGRATMTNVTVRQLIQASHDILPYQLVGLPSWADSARFDLTATSNANATPAELLLMVRDLLADRFQFSTRRETRQLDTYSLVEMTPGSAKLRRSAADCEAVANAPLDQTLAATPGGRDGQPRCQVLPMTGRGRLIGTGMRLSGITNVLTGVVGRLVVDKTGLSGPFDVNLAWTPDPALQAVVRPPDALSVPDAPSIFTAIEEQLGLRLVSDRAPVELIVVERLEQPTSD